MKRSIQQLIEEGFLVLDKEASDACECLMYNPSSDDITISLTVEDDDVYEPILDVNFDEGDSEAYAISPAGGDRINETKVKLDKQLFSVFSRKAI